MVASLSYTKSYVVYFFAQLKPLFLFGRLKWPEIVLEDTNKAQKGFIWISCISTHFVFPINKRQKKQKFRHNTVW